MLTIRILQTLHIEGFRYGDIAYNFLIGGDGQAYEGRGWNKIGALCDNIKSESIQIAFVGTFVREEPPAIAINTCEKLIKAGIEIGAISSDFQLLGRKMCAKKMLRGNNIQTLHNWFDEI